MKLAKPVLVAGDELATDPNVEAPVEAKLLKPPPAFPDRGDPKVAVPPNVGGLPNFGGEPNAGAPPNVAGLPKPELLPKPDEL